jgi:hypothetical protein
VPSPAAMKIDGRSRVSRGSSERQVLHSQPIIGTPCDVPVPRNVICNWVYGSMIRRSPFWAWT